MKHRRINYKQLFKKYPMGYARYRDWLIDMSRMCAKYPLDCDFLCGAWLLKWRALGRLLTKPAMVGVRQGRTGRIEWYKLSAKYGQTVAHCLLHADERRKHDRRLLMVVKLLDGAIIKESGAHVAD
jgi:hypothetical protein